MKTSDPTQILPYCLAALGAGVALLVLGMAIKKRQREEDREEGGSQE